MSNLISREALLDDIRKTITEKSDTMDWLNMISRQPAAYDVDKVVEQIEKIMEDETIRFADQVVRKTIKIVKAGGVDE